MKKIILIAFALVIAISCSKETKKTVTSQKKKIEKRNVNDILIFDNLLIKENIENAEYNNITFQKEGAVFLRNTERPTYIKIPFSKLDFTQAFNVSFTFKTTFDDGRKPQSFLAFVNKSSSSSQIPFYIYFPGNKISGVYGKQLLWAEKYDKKNGKSRVFFDSYKIETDQFYFVSVNFTGEAIEIYVNSELYAIFEDLIPHDFKSTDLIIGSNIQGAKMTRPFEGILYGLKIFNQPLKESEIVNLFNSQPEFLNIKKVK